MSSLNDENAMPPPQPREKDANAATRNTTQSRRALGDVSPNIPVNAPIANAIAQGKRIAGSPLKRSFTAALESGSGFTYLKKRKLSIDRPLSQLDGTAESRRSREAAAGNETPRQSSSHTATRPARSPTHDQLPQGSPTEPNTPSDSEATIDQPSSGERGSFSSLINYDPSSQPNTTYHSQPQPRVRQQTSSSSSSSSKLVFKPVTKAEMLRLRLRIAMYKVRTNQIDVPFSQLRVEGPGVENGGESPPLTAEAVEEAVAVLRREAREELDRQREKDRLQRERDGLPERQELQPQRGLMPGFVPVFKPTAYSSRTIHSLRREEEGQEHSSSLPAPRGPQGGHGHPSRSASPEKPRRVRAGS